MKTTGTFVALEGTDPPAELVGMTNEQGLINGIITDQASNALLPIFKILHRSPTLEMLGGVSQALIANGFEMWAAFTTVMNAKRPPEGAIPSETLKAASSLSSAYGSPIVGNLTHQLDLRPPTMPPQEGALNAPPAKSGDPDWRGFAADAVRLLKIDLADRNFVVSISGPADNPDLTASLIAFPGLTVTAMISTIESEPLVLSAYHAVGTAPRNWLIRPHATTKMQLLRAVDVLLASLQAAGVFNAPDRRNTMPTLDENTLPDLCEWALREHRLQAVSFNDSCSFRVGKLRLTVEPIQPTAVLPFLIGIDHEGICTFASRADIDAARMAIGLFAALTKLQPKLEDFSSPLDAARRIGESLAYLAAFANKEWGVNPTLSEGGLMITCGPFTVAVKMPMVESYDVSLHHHERGAIFTRSTNAEGVTAALGACLSVLMAQKLTRHTLADAEKRLITLTGGLVKARISRDAAGVVLIASLHDRSVCYFIREATDSVPDAAQKFCVEARRGLTGGLIFGHVGSFDEMIGIIQGAQLTDYALS